MEHPNLSPADQLLQVQMMYERGTLTAEEFSETKRRIIAGIGEHGTAQADAPTTRGIVARSTAGSFALALLLITLILYAAAYANPAASAGQVDTAATVLGFLLIVATGSAVVGLFIDRNRFPAMAACIIAALVMAF